MHCNICGHIETAIYPDGNISKAVRPHVNSNKNATAILCSKCSYLVSKCMAKIDWNMDLDGLQQALKQKHASYFIRTKDNQAKKIKATTLQRTK